MDRAGAGIGLALLSAATFGTSGSFGHSLIGAGWSPAAAVAVRIGIAAAILLVPAVLALRGRWRVLRGNTAMIVCYGLGAVAGAQVCFFNAIRTLPVGVALLLEYLGTVLVVGWMWLRHGQAPRRLTVIGAAVALGGLALVLDLTGGARLDPVGVLWGLGAALGLATYFVLSSGVSDDLPPVVVVGGGMAVGALVLVGLGVAGVLPLHASFGTVVFAGLRTSWLVPVAGLAVLAAAVAYVVGIAAAQRLGARLASFLGLTEVVFAVLFAWLLLGELPTATQLAGGLAIVAGIALVRVDEQRVPAPVLIAPEPAPALGH